MSHKPGRRPSEGWSRKYAEAWDNLSRAEKWRDNFNSAKTQKEREWLLDNCPTCHGKGEIPHGYCYTCEGGVGPTNIIDEEFMRVKPHKIKCYVCAGLDPNCFECDGSGEIQVAGDHEVDDE